MAGEEAKDSHYLESVTNDGGDFILLVCESSAFGLLLHCPLFLHTTVKNGLSQKLAWRQLLQCLSVTLWKYNAKMVLRCYALCLEDTIDFVQVL